MTATQSISLGHSQTLRCHSNCLHFVKCPADVRDGDHICDRFSARGLGLPGSEEGPPASVATPAPTHKPISLPSHYTHAGIAGTWDGARNWLRGASACEAAKLFCQVMAGFELIALKAQLGVTNGGDRRSKDAKSESHDGILIWSERVEKELGTPHSTANRWEVMAQATAIKLKRLPELKDFNPLSSSIASLPAPQVEALKKAVHKVTDGRTQKEFGESLGLWKKPQGSGAKGRTPGEGGRKKLSISDQAELLKLQAAEDWKCLDKSLSVYRDKFTCLTDTDIQAQIAALEQALTARKTWLKQPIDQRDPKAIAALFS